MLNKIAILADFDSPQKLFGLETIASLGSPSRPNGLPIGTFDGWNPAPVEVGSLSHYL